MTSVIPTIGHFYDVDKEVCGILEGCRKPHGASRPLCRNPILWTLEFSDVCPQECSTLYCTPLLYSMADCEEAKLYKYDKPEGEFSFSDRAKGLTYLVALVPILVVT